MTRFFSKNLVWTVPLAFMGLTGCTRDHKFQPVDMWNGSRLKPYEGFNFFPDKTVSQVPPAGTVARGQERESEPIFYGTQNGTLIRYNPIMDAATTPQARKALIERGQERFNIYCQPCHGLGGYGDGMIVKRGFAKPPSYHIDRLREVSDGHLYNVISKGYGAMYSYGARVPTRDRWAIVAYIRTMQRSQNASAADVPAGVKLDTKPVVQPPIGEAENFGPSAGGAAHNTGATGADQTGASHADETTQKGEMHTEPAAH